ncbi:Protein of unknown function (DUF3592) [Bernardetia litoralis DSM 6794]|uniref:DUF3592 domain-containing protein n=1 Tax=Bernardetia litoralis (strain ATCC 23117 / DSM 6794 / NBRC 15988 / NCIMB 1366 / Fx l1 / Sio-4) TaxID=880071 RepID=I4AMS1_BERLS|nr:DUF3592 domain-containing protein [Bernardetia litoralis]AFM05256.1 Protein of unknown function (DUF3592) [Bernardetia litoralis DSM 6794]
MNQVTKNKIIGIVMIVMGFFFLFLSGVIFWGIQNDKSESIKTIATVVDYETSLYDGRTEYQSIFEYQNEDGTIIQFKDAIANSEPRFEINEDVEILYIPNEKNSEQINTIFTIYLLPVIFFVLGFGSSFLGYQVFKNKVVLYKV